MRGLSLIAVLSSLTYSALAGAACPGNVLDGPHISIVGNPAGNWHQTLNSATGQARIFKADAQATGKVGSWLCDGNNWSATMVGMSNQLTYTCSGTISGNKLSSGKCMTENGGSIDISGGDFLTSQ
ncbi:hypothetical protein AWB76_06757 [Caballeronia temeraria]|uniref:Lipoprotein n=1 Tax=Caballeronia temeraria TaxID=1777137 RepID=A0A158DBN1_9BURK|nr:hypothetical protein [Caballeronia temeraria]SAK92072.1 hypothetical protein AWB76_06757 [Caballeronia temeraria]